jgi:hypothetical protein
MKTRSRGVARPVPTDAPPFPRTTTPSPHPQAEFYALEGLVAAIDRFPWSLVHAVRAAVVEEDAHWCGGRAGAAWGHALARAGTARIPRRAWRNAAASGS